jgi:Fe-S-cluster containining protein
MPEMFVPPVVTPTKAATDEPPTRSELEEALRFLNHAATQTRLSHSDIGATLKALVEVLVARGVLPHAEFERRRQRALDAVATRLEEQPMVRFGAAVDKYGLKDLPDIDCASIIPICKARCCTLSVFCSAQDLDEGVVKWDYARPYQIRKREDDYCVHSEPETRRCGIYAQRPAICRSYDCRDDRRIWKDFEQRILAEEA